MCCCTGVYILYLRCVSCSTVMGTKLIAHLAGRDLAGHAQSKLRVKGCWFQPAAVLLSIRDEPVTCCNAALKAAQWRLLLCNASLALLSITLAWLATAAVTAATDHTQQASIQLHLPMINNQSAPTQHEQPTGTALTNSSSRPLPA